MHRLHKGEELHVEFQGLAPILHPVNLSFLATLCRLGYSGVESYDAYPPGAAFPARRRLGRLGQGAPSRQSRPAGVESR